MPPSETLVLLGLRNLHHARSIEARSKRSGESRRHVLRDDQGGVDVIMQMPE
jgi:hypothetical protein